MDAYYTYILYSDKLDKFYIGSTADVEERLTLHNSGKSKFTSRGVPWRLVYLESFSTLHEAMVREYEIKKKKSRKYIEWLISEKE